MTGLQLFTANLSFTTDESLPIESTPILSEDRQIYVPGSFIALYVPRGQIKPIKPREEIEAKYDYCEDLAQLLLQAMHDKVSELNLPIDIAFSRVSNVLVDPNQNLNLSEVEATWVLSRLKELSESGSSFKQL